MSSTGPSAPLTRMTWPPTATWRSITPKSIPSRCGSAPISAHRSSSTWAASTGCPARMACAPGLMMPAFSRAISVTVRPSRWVWSRSIGVTTATPASATLVASQVPPRPTSTTATSIGASAKAAKAIAVMISKKVSSTPSISRSSTSATYGSISRHVASKRSSLIGAPSMVIRSVTLVTCGDVNRPVRRPSARSRDSIMAAVLPLPLVPVRWITG